ncbi:MAG: tRNA lysidine(34) synthetase TilS [Candidatus Saccharimonadaceae bacterium]
MKYIVAVSGGVDSMALLDMMVRSGEHDLVVAHFDHGIRPDSHVDAQLVREVALKHGLLFETKREELGPSASEAFARDRRYAFLRDLAQKHEATIVTAHHLDDLVETVAINANRGTGWRGLAALDSDVSRPLLDFEKSQLIEYAQRHNLAWREDSTNTNTSYLRNRIRPQTHVLPTETKREVRALHTHQKALKRQINDEVHAIIGEGPQYSRYFFTNLPTVVAYECLREITKGKLTRPQLVRVLHAVKVAKPHATFEAGDGIKFHFSTRQFSL